MGIAEGVRRKVSRVVILHSTVKEEVLFKKDTLPIDINGAVIVVYFIGIGL